MRFARDLYASQTPYLSVFTFHLSVYKIKGQPNGCPFILQTESEKAAIYQLPFLTPYSIEKTDEKNNDAQNEFDFSNNARLKFQQELYEEACKQIKKDVENHSDCISIFCGHLFKELKRGNLKRILLVATGALMNATIVQQGESIPVIAHAIGITTEN